MRRRELLRLGALGWIACRGRSEPVVEPAVRTAEPRTIDDRVLDELYEQIHAKEHAAEHGLSTHAPMVVEAICTLGAADRAKAWLASYRGTRVDVPTPHAPIDPARWREALGPDRGASTWEAAVAKVPRRTTAPRGNIVAGLRAAGQLARFDTVRDLIATPADLGAGISTLAATFSRVYLQHAEANTIAFVHAVTGPCALRRIAPHVSAGTASAAFPYAWQAAAAIYAAYATADRAAPRIEPALSRDELAGRALENGNDHAIKFAEVLLAEHALTGDAAFLAAGQDAVTRL